MELTGPALQWRWPGSITGRHTVDGSDQMPTLFKFLTILAILAGIAYGGMFALVTLVEPKPGEMTVRIPVDKVNPPRE